MKKGNASAAKRVFSLFLTLLILIGAFPATSAAAANEVSRNEETQVTPQSTAAELTTLATTAHTAQINLVRTSSRFIDSSSIRYAEAVESLSNLGVLTGYAEGSGFVFHPTRNISRAEASTIICRILVGPDIASNLPNLPSSFIDVSDTHWANPYIEFCVDKGIIAGHGDGRFAPNDNVTSTQMAKMLLVAIGYGSNGEYEGANWDTNTIDKAQSVGIEVLSPTGSNFSAPATREQVAQYTFNTLTIPNLVSWDAARGSYSDLGVNLLRWTFGLADVHGRGGYIDPDEFGTWDYRDRVVDGFYYTKQGFQITERDYRDMLTKRVQIFAEIITPGMSEYDKVQAVHDWICLNVKYNYDVWNGEWNPNWEPTLSDYWYEHQLGWAAIILGIAVCAGYADAFQFLLDGLDIESLYVVGPMTDSTTWHAWNIVRLDGVHYKVDTTWNVAGEYGVSYRYFLISDATMSEIGRRDWDRTEYPRCPRDYDFPTMTMLVNDSSFGLVWGSSLSAYVHSIDTPTVRAVRGMVFRLNAYANRGYEFVRWEVVSGNATISNATSPNATVTMPNANATIRAHFMEIPGQAVTTSVNNPAWGSASASRVTAQPGTRVAIHAVPNVGYVFDRWEIISGNVAIGNLNSPNLSFVMPNHDVHFRAHFRELAGTAVTVSVNNPSWGTASASHAFAEQGATVTLQAQAGSGAVFESWEVISGGVSLINSSLPNATFVMPSGNVHIRAHFRQGQAVIHAVQMSTNNPAWGTAGSDPVSAARGATVRLFAIAADHYTIDYWEVVSGGVTINNPNMINASFTMLDGDVHIRAHFKQVRGHSVNISSNENGLGQPRANPRTAMTGETVSLIADPAPGIDFERWEVISGDVTIANINSQETTFTMPDSAVSIRAHYKRQPVSRSVVANVNNPDAGTVSADTRSALPGTTVNLTASPRSGYAFDRWEVVSGGITLSDANSRNASFTMPDNVVSVIAHFRAEIYDISISVNDSAAGSARADLSQAHAGRNVELRATANSGYRFDRWEVVSGDVTLRYANSAYFTMPAGDVHLRAHFIPITSNTVTVSMAEPIPGVRIVARTSTQEGTSITAMTGERVELRVSYSHPYGHELELWELVSGDTFIYHETFSIAGFMMQSQDVHIVAHFRER